MTQPQLPCIAGGMKQPYHLQVLRGSADYSLVQLLCFAKSVNMKIYRLTYINLTCATII